MAKTITAYWKKPRVGRPSATEETRIHAYLLELVAGAIRDNDPARLERCANDMQALADRLDRR